LTVAVTPDGRWAISASTDRTLKIWDIAPLRDQGKAGSNTGLTGGDELCTLTNYTEVVLAIAVTPDCEASPESSAGGGWRIISASADCTLKVWDISTLGCRTCE
jgi:WD40 repeat protein